MRIVLLVWLVMPLAWASAQYRNYSLPCLAPILENIDPDAPRNLQEAFLAGPKQFAEPLEGVGAEAIDFEISTESAEAQQMFNQGVGLLHVLWYKEAERAFRTVVALDPDCPMGYWGLAQASELQPGRARVFAAAAKDRCDRNRPELEQAWIEILVDFYKEGDLASRSRARINALEELSLDHPDNIEVSAFLIRYLTLDAYRTELYVTSPLGVDQLAQNLAERAPDHPSRHYRAFLWLDRRPTRVLEDAAAMPKLTPNAAEVWRYAAEVHLDAGRAAEAVWYLEAAIRIDHRDPFRAQNLASNYKALINALTDAGRIEEAVIWAKRASHLPRYVFPRETLGIEARMQAGQWDLLLEELDPAAADNVVWRGLAHLALNQIEEADDALKNLDEQQRQALIDGASPQRERELADFRRILVSAQQLLKTGDSKVVDELNLPPLAKAAFLERAGLNGEAFQLVTAETAKRPNRWLANAVACRLATETGNQRDAFFRFDRQFRMSSSLADEGLPIFADLEPIAKDLQLPGDWTLPASDAPLKNLDDLGLETWIPASAPDFKLSDQNSGKPVLLNFFLGVRCPFCLQQFKAFEPFLPEFEAEGISFVGISIDSAESLKLAFADEALQSSIPFSVLPDPDLELFRAFKVFDEFEDGPMHATFLISPKGEILWRDIGHAPFDQPRQLLEEAKRLLAICQDPDQAPN